MAFQIGLDPAHVVAAVRQLIPVDDQSRALELLGQIKGNADDVVWRQLAVLNLAGGRIDLLPVWIKEANTDLRDVKFATEKYLEQDWDAKYRWPATVNNAKV